MNECVQLSVILPVYNCEKYIKNCLNSILEQKIETMEIIIINDGSNDNTLKECQKFAIKDPRIKIISTVNNGVSSARNLGIENSCGKYIVFIDADDYIENDMLIKMLNTIEDNDIVICNYRKIFGKKIIEKKEKFTNNNIVSLLEKIVSGNGYLWNKMFVRKIIVENELRFNEEIYICEDYEFLIRYVSKIKKFDWINECLYNYYVREESATQNKKIDKYKTLFNAFDSIINTLKFNNIDSIINKVQFQYCIELIRYKIYFKLGKEKDEIDIKINQFYRLTIKSDISTIDKFKLFFYKKGFYILYFVKKYFKFSRKI